MAGLNDTPVGQAGIHSTIAPFPVGEVRATADLPAYDRMLGMVIEGARGEKYRLVEASEAAAAAVAARCVWKRDGDDNLYTVDIADGVTDRPYGITVPDQEAIAIGDAFWVQIAGRCAATAGAANSGVITAGDYAHVTAEAGLGHLETNNTTFVEGVTNFRALETTAADGDECICEIIQELNG